MGKRRHANKVQNKANKRKRYSANVSSDDQSDDDKNSSDEDVENIDVEVKQTSYHEIVFNGEINRKNIVELGCILRKMASKMQRIAWRRGKQYSDDTITVYLTSDGGEVEAGFAGADMIMNLNVFVKIIVCGVAASSATLLAMSATNGLFLYENSTLLIHQLSTGLLNGTVKEIHDFNISAKKLHDQMLSFYKKRCPDLKTSNLNYLMSHDLVLNANDCYEYKLISDII